MGRGAAFPLAPVLASETVATPAPVAAQPNAIGQEVHRLTKWLRKLYVAYGDYNANTGPIQALSIDLDTLTVTSEATLHTEETWEARVLSDGLNVPYYDPQGGSAEPATGQYATASTPGSWTVHTDVGPDVPVHAFDMAENSEGKWLVGATDMPDDGPTIWHQPTGGSWATDLHSSNLFARVYCIVALGDDLLAGEDTGGTPVLHYRPSGGTWTSTETPGKHYSSMTAFTVNGTPLALVVPNQKNSGQSIAATTAFAVGRPADAGAVRTFSAGIPGGIALAATATATYLYLLCADRTVWRCDSTGVWSEVGRVDVAVTCLEVDEDGGYLYFGTADSRVLRAPLPT